MMIKVCQLSNEYPHERVGEKEYEDWTDAQDEAVRLLKSGVEYVEILERAEDDGQWYLLQELNLERGIVGKQFSTHVLAPYYVRLRNYEG